VVFYIHKTAHGLSQFPRPPEASLDLYEPINLQSVNVGELVAKYGMPYYIKIDVEHYDSKILEALFKSGIYPEYLSAESHSASIFCLLYLNGYNGFKLVQGKTVSLMYRSRKIKCIHSERVVQYSFPRHSSGPFADDIDGPWYDGDSFFRILAMEGFGWKDVHATRLIDSNSRMTLRTRDVLFWKAKKIVLYWCHLVIKFLGR